MPIGRTENQLFSASVIQINLVPADIEATAYPRLRTTTVGLATRGSSGNPRSFKLPGVAVEVMYSRWVDMMPDGTPIEGRGVRPEIEVNLAQPAYEDADPTWARAVALLRAKVKAKK